jgi:uncharacterized protein
VEYVKKAGGEKRPRVKFSIATNGLLLDNEKIDYLLKNNFTVLLSFDGSKECYEANRKTVSGKSVFDEVVRNARKMKEKGLYHFVNMS